MWFLTAQDNIELAFTYHPQESMNLETMYRIFDKMDMFTRYADIMLNNITPNDLNPFPHGMFWTKVIYDLASSEPYSLSSLNSKIFVEWCFIAFIRM